MRNANHSRSNYIRYRRRSMYSKRGIVGDCLFARASACCSHQLWGRRGIHSPLCYGCIGQTVRATRRLANVGHAGGGEGAVIDRGGGVGGGAGGHDTAVHAVVIDVKSTGISAAAGDGIRCFDLVSNPTAIHRNNPRSTTHLYPSRYTHKDSSQEPAS